MTTQTKENPEVRQEKDRIIQLLQDKIDKISYRGNEWEYIASTSRETTLQEVINLLK